MVQILTSPNKKTLEHRVNNIIGQLEAVKPLLTARRDCFTVIIELKAAKAAIGAVLDKYIEAEADRCLLDRATQADNDKLKKLLTIVCKK
jgi:DNA-binding FrmR family transcriptional regulator